MFRKPIKVKNNVKSKSSERKKFIEQVLSSFSVSAENGEALFSKKDLYKLKIQSGTGEHMFVYTFDNVPFFIEFENQIIPTVYLLWECPDLVPSFATHDAVVPKLQNGADLMLPGIVIQSESLSPTTYGNLRKGNLCSINTVRNRAPIAIGHANLSSHDMFMSAGRGKAVNIFHIYGDEIWALGKKSTPPQLSWLDVTMEMLSDDEDAEGSESPEKTVDDHTPKDGGMNPDMEEGSEAGACAGLPENMANMGIDNSDKESLTPDELLLQCFMHALRFSAKDKLLPMPTNLFWAKHLLKFCPSDQQLEIKKTSYKKVSLFMKAMKGRGIISLEEANGVQTLLAVDRSHAEWRSFQPFLEERSESSSVPSAEESDDRPYAGPPLIEEVWFLLDKTLPIFRSAGYNKGDCLTMSEIRDVITKYVKENELQSSENKGFVRLDCYLTDALYNKNDKIHEELRWKDLVDRMSSRMTDGYRMSFANERPIFRKKEKIPSITIETISRGGKKSSKVTRVANLDQFRISQLEFSKTVQHGRACSCGLVTDAQARQVVQAQGDQRDYIGQILIEKYQIPRKYVFIKEDSKPKKQ